MNTEQIAKILALRKEGMSSRDIGNVMSLSHSTVSRALLAAGLPEAEPQDAEPMRQASEPMRQASEQMRQASEPMRQDAGPMRQASEPMRQDAGPMRQASEPTVDTITALLAATVEQLAAYQGQQQDLSTTRAALLQADDLDEQALAEVDAQSTALAGRIQHTEQRIPLLEERIEDAEANHATARLAELPAEAERLCEAKRVALLDLDTAYQAILKAQQAIAKLHAKHAELGAEEVYWVDRYRLPRTRLEDIGEQPSLATLEHEIGGIWGPALTSVWTQRRQALNNAPRKFHARKTVPQPIPAPIAPVAPPGATGELFLEGHGHAVWDERGVTFTAGTLIDGNRLSAPGVTLAFSWQQIVQLAQEKHLPPWTQHVPAITARVEHAFAAMRAAGDDPHVNVQIRDEHVTRTDMLHGTGVTLSFEQLREKVDRAGTLPGAWDFPAIRTALRL